MTNKQWLDSLLANGTTNNAAEPWKANTSLTANMSSKRKAELDATIAKSTTKNYGNTVKSFGTNTTATPWQPVSVYNLTPQQYYDKAVEVAQNTQARRELEAAKYAKAGVFASATLPQLSYSGAKQYTDFLSAQQGTKVYDPATKATKQSERDKTNQELNALRERVIGGDTDPTLTQQIAEKKQQLDVLDNDLLKYTDYNLDPKQYGSKLNEMAANGAKSASNPLTVAKMIMTSPNPDTAAAMIGGGLDKADYYRYLMMSPDEQKLYNAFYAEDPKKAEAYLNNLSMGANNIAQRAGERAYNEMNKEGIPGFINKTSVNLSEGINSGLQNIGGVVDALKGSTEYNPTSASAYQASEINENATPIGKAWYDIMQSTGNMLPGMVASAALGPGGFAVTSAKIAQAVGSTVFALSQAGSAYRDAINSGNTVSQARGFALQQGIDEEATNWLLGGISKFGGGALKKLLANSEMGQSVINGIDNLAKTEQGKKVLGRIMAYIADGGSEAAQEFLQYFTEGFSREFFLGEKFDIDMGEAAYAAALGAANAFLLNVGQPISDIASSANVNTSYAESLKNQTFANEDLAKAGESLQKISESIENKKAEGKRVNAIDKLGRGIAENEFSSSLNEAYEKGEIDDATYLQNIINLGRINGDTRYEREESNGEDSSRGQGDRQNDLDGGRGSSGIQSSAEQAANGRATANDGIRTQAETEKWELKSAADYNVKNGTSDKTVYEIPDEYIEKGETELARELQTIKTEAAKSGRKVSFVVGVLGVNEGGSTYGVRGVIQPDGSMIIRADSDYASATNIYKHEEFHGLKKTNPNIVADTKKRFLNTHTEEELTKTLIDYAKAYKYGVFDENGNFDMNKFNEKADKILEEVLADAYANMPQITAELDEGVHEIRKSAKREAQKAKSVETKVVAEARAQKESEAMALKKAQETKAEQSSAIADAVVKNDSEALAKAVKNATSLSAEEIELAKEEGRKKIKEAKKAKGLKKYERKQNKYLEKKGKPIQSVKDVKKALRAGESAESITKELAPEELYTKEDIKHTDESYSRELDANLMKKANKYNSKTGDTYGHADPELLEKVAELRTKVKVELDKLEDLLPIDIAGQTMKDNASYGKSIENSLICPRSLVSAYFLDIISEKLGRPLSINEQIVACQILADATGMQQECTYCYVKNDRAKYRDFFNTYYDAYIDIFNKAKSNKKGYQNSIKQGKSKDNALYQEFLNGRKNTDNMWNRYVAFAKDGISGKQSISLSDLATAGTRYNAAKDSKKKFLIDDSEAYCRSSAWPVNTERIIKRKGKEIALEYIAYNGSILNLKPDMIDTLNSSFGLRMYSYSDYVPHNILENIQMVTDASVRGLKMLAYTKDANFARIFAKTGMGINISVFGEIDPKTGKMIANEMMGASWAEAQKIRKEHPNVGIVFVATSKEAVKWALSKEQDWIDVVIPTHTVRTGSEVFNAFNYEDFKGNQEDVKTEGWDKDRHLKSIPPTVHGNDKAKYLKALEDNHLSPRFAEYKDNPNYMKLVNETRMAYTELQPVQPIFDEQEVMAEIDRIKKMGAYGLSEGIKDKETQEELLSDYADKATEKIGKGINADEKGWALETKHSKEIDDQYLAAVKSKDTKTAQKMVDEAANKYLNKYLLPNDADEKGFKYHRGKAPTKTLKRYAVFNVNPDGFHAAYAGNKTPTPVGVWLDAQNLQSYMSDITQFDDGSYATYIAGDTGASVGDHFSKSAQQKLGLKGGMRFLLERGGKHSSDVPNFSQMNTGKDENGNKVANFAKDGALPHNKLIFEIEYGMDDDGDLTDYVRENGRMSKGKNQGLAKIEPNQYYDFKTNPNAVGNWGIGGTFRIVRLVPYEEVVSKTNTYKKDTIAEAKNLYESGAISKRDYDKRVKNAEAISTQKWVGGYHPEDFGLTVEKVDEMYRDGQKMKLLDPVTYDDNGEVIPLSKRFDSSNEDIRYSREITPEMLKQKPRYTPEEMNWQIDKTKTFEREKADMRLKKAKEQSNAKYDKLKATDKAKLAETKAQSKAKHNEEIKKLKTAEQQKLDAQKQKFEERIAREKEHRRESVALEKEAKHNAIRKIREEHNEQLLNKRQRTAEAKIRHKVLKQLREARRYIKNHPGMASEELKRIIDGVDNKSVRMLPGTAEDLKKLRDDINKLADEDPDFARLHKERMLAKTTRLDETQLYDMDIEDVIDIGEEIAKLRHYQQTQDKFFRESKHKQISEAATALMDEINNVKPLNKANPFIKKTSDYITNSLNPLRAMRRISGYQHDSVLEEQTRKIYDGETKVVDLTKKFLQPFDEFVQNKKNRQFVNEASKQNIPITVKGKTYYISKGMRVALYMHSKHTDNLTHIAKGGITIPDPKLYEKGDYSNAYGNNVVVLDPTQVENILHDMTPEELEYAKLLKNFFDEAADAINETSLEMDGILRAMVEDYFPITSDPDFLAASIDFINDPTLEGWGSLKARVNGNNPILLEDATRVLERHIRKTAQYAGLAAPLRDFQKVFNYTKAAKGNVRIANDGVKTNYITEDHKDALIFSSVQKAIKNAWDAETVKYIEDFLKDVNSGGRKAERGVFEGVRSAYANATLTLNPSVALKQTTSYFMAGSILSTKSLAYGLTHKFSKSDETYMDSITPWGWNRRRGQSTIELGDMAKKKGLTSKIPNWNQAMDVITTNALFIATERDIQKQFPDLKRGDAEYDKALAEKYNEVLWRTQPQYDVAFRPEYMRRTDIASRTFGMFKTESMQMMGELMDAYGQYKADQKSGADPAESKKTFYKTFGSWTASNLAFAAMGAVLKFALHNIKGYRDDEGEIDPNAVLQEILSGFVSSSMGGFFYGSTIYDTASFIAKKAQHKDAQWYDIEAPGLSIINDMISSGGSLISAVTADNATPESITKAVSRFALDVSKATPVGFAENVYKMADAVNLYIQDIANGELWNYEAGTNLLNLKDTSVTSKQYTTRTVNAYADGNDERGTDAYKKLVNQVGTDKADDKIRTALSDDLKNGGTLAYDIIENSEDENIRDIAIKLVYDYEKDSKQKPSTVDVIEGLDISNADKGKVYAESTTSEKLKNWRENGGSEYDYYVATQKIAPSIPEKDADGNDVDEILYIKDKIDSGEITDGQASAWLAAEKSNTKSYEMWSDAGGSDKDYFKAYTEIKEIKGKNLDNDIKKARVVSKIKEYIKDSENPEATARAMWEMTGYSFDSTKDKKKVEDGNFLKSFPQFKRKTASADAPKYLAAPGKSKSKGNLSYNNTLPNSGKVAMMEEYSDIGQYGEGNIDLYNRPMYYQKDGSLSTVNSISIEVDGKQVVIPTIVSKNGKPTQLTDDEAIDWFFDTGEYLGKFNTIKEAEDYAKKLHLQQEEYYKNYAKTKSKVKYLAMA